MRHTGAGLAIPDFPLMFGRLWPDHWNAAIAIHFAHRIGALLVAAMALVTSIYIWRIHTDRPELASPALLVLILIVIQITLGAVTVLSGRQPLINSLHVVGGALVLTTSLVITLRSWQVRIADRGLPIADWEPDGDLGSGATVRNPQSAIRNVDVPRARA
jgi:heme a synthase